MIQNYRKCRGTETKTDHTLSDIEGGERVRFGNRPPGNIFCSLAAVYKGKEQECHMKEIAERERGGPSNRPLMKTLSSPFDLHRLPSMMMALDFLGRVLT